MKVQTENFLDTLCFVTENQFTEKDYLKKLTLSERQTLTKKHPKKRLPSAMGRMAVKNAIRKYVGTSIPYSAIDVFNDSNGVPQYKIYGQQQNTPISISHTRDIAIGGLANNTKGFGLDIEKIRIFNENTVRSFLTDSEWAYYTQLEVDSKAIFPTLAWSIKEATLKALGKGLRLHPRSIAIKISPKLQVIRISIAGSNLEVMASWTFFKSSYIIVSTRLYEKS